MRQRPVSATKGFATASDRRFPRAARLLVGAQFKQVFAAPQRSADRFFTVLAGPARSGPARLGLAISKKQARRSVDRNRLKRLVRETFRHHRGLLEGRDLVVLARAAAVHTSNERLRNSLTQLFAKLGKRTS